MDFTLDSMVSSIVFLLYLADQILRANKITRIPPLKYNSIHKIAVQRSP